MRRFTSSVLGSRMARSPTLQHGSPAAGVGEFQTCMYSYSLSAALSRCYSQAQSSNINSLRCYATTMVDELPLETERQRLVILGTGWAAARLTTDIDTSHFDLTVSSRNLPEQPMHRVPKPALCNVHAVERHGRAVPAGWSSFRMRKARHDMIARRW